MQALLSLLASNQADPSLSGSDVEALYSVGHTFYSQHCYDQALSLFRLLVQVQPYDAKLWMGLGATWQMMQHYPEAIDAYRIAACLDEENPFPPFHVGECLIALQQLEEGFLALEAAEKRFLPHHHKFRERLEALREAWKKEEQIS